MARLAGVRIVPDAKLVRYLLNSEHPTGAAKARFFIAHGFDIGQVGMLERALLMHADAHPVHSERNHAFGVNRAVRCQLETPDSRNPCIMTVWSQDNGSRSQRFVTAYPAPET